MSRTPRAARISSTDTPSSVISGSTRSSTKPTASGTTSGRLRLRSWPCATSIVHRPADQLGQAQLELPLERDRDHAGGRPAKPVGVAAAGGLRAQREGHRDRVDLVGDRQQGAGLAGRAGCRRLPPAGDAPRWRRQTASASPAWRAYTDPAYPCRSANSDTRLDTRSALDSWAARSTAALVAASASDRSPAGPPAPPPAALVGQRTAALEEADPGELGSHRLDAQIEVAAVARRRRPRAGPPAPPVARRRRPRVGQPLETNSEPGREPAGLDAPGSTAGATAWRSPAPGAGSSR